MSVMTSMEWKELRKDHGVDKGRIKESVAKKLDAYHKAKDIDAAIEALREVFAALVDYRLKLDPKKDEKFIKAIMALTDDVGKRQKKLEERQKLSRDIEKLDFKAVMSGGGPYKKKFYEFTKKERNQENFDFYAESAKSPKGKAAKKIYETYIADKAKNQININDSAKTDLDTKAAAEQWDQMNFKPARAEIAKLMQDDVIPRFKQWLQETLNKAALKE